MSGELEQLRQRTGARRRSEIPATVLKYLHRGELETANLVEFLAVDHARLLKQTAGELPLADTTAKAIAKQVKKLQVLGILQRMVQTGKAFHDALPDTAERMRVYTALAAHPSDILRSWAAYMDAANDALTFTQRIRNAKAFAADHHMGVREFAWMAVRLPVGEELAEHLDRLVPLGRNKDVNVRRFAIELTRPCGVWCKHLQTLKQHPEPAVELLETCRKDKSKYVQDSVANWLNDASKSRPDFVIQLTDRWLSECDSPATQRICHRALRTLRKQG